MIMCVSPYIATKKTGEKVCVPCGKCIECRKAYQNEWTFRLSQEMKRTHLPVFVTLTYNEENVPLVDFDCGNNVDYETGELVEQTCLVKSDLQKFFKRLRKNGGELMNEMRYFAVGEYGRKYNRCHYHAVIMAPNVTMVSQVKGLIEKCWTFGFVSVKRATQKQVHYVCKYMNKLDARPHPVKPFRLYSRGLGLNYLSDKMVAYYLETFDRFCINGHCKISLPRYYRRKLDELSVNHYMLSKCGLTYTDLLEDVRQVEGTHYYLFKTFCDHFEDYYILAVREYARKSRACGYQYITPTDQEVFECFRRSQKLLCDLLIESDRKIKECQIRNGLIGLEPLSLDSFVVHQET